MSLARATRSWNKVLPRRCVHIEAKIESLGLKMPSAAVPKGNFVNFVRIGNMVYVSGHLPQPAEGALVVGKVGKELTVEDGTNTALAHHEDNYCPDVGCYDLFQVTARLDWWV
jgi:enamine deaminase RidA (YjgF/YER057c/UK114 family)